MIRNNRFRIAIAVLIVAWSSLFIIAGVFMGEGFLRSSDFFQVGPPVNVHGVLIESKKHYWMIVGAVFANSLVSSTSYYFVHPVVRRTVLGVKGVSPVQNKLGFLLLVFIYDSWWITRTMITLLGYTTQLGFLLAHAAGMILATESSVALYLYKPQWFADEVPPTRDYAPVMHWKKGHHGHEHD